MISLIRRYNNLLTIVQARPYVCTSFSFLGLTEVGFFLSWSWSTLGGEGSVGSKLYDGGNLRKKNKKDLVFYVELYISNNSSGILINIYGWNLRGSFIYHGERFSYHGCPKKERVNKKDEKKDKRIFRSMSHTRNHWAPSKHQKKKGIQTMFVKE